MRYVRTLTILSTLIIALIPIQAGGEQPGDVDRLVATQEVIETVNRLFILTDKRDWSGVAQVFAPEVRFDMTSLGAETPEVLTPAQITTAWDKGLRHLKAIHHQVGNYVVMLGSNGAEVFCYGIASHYLPNPSGKNVRIFVGSYDLHLIKSTGRWLIDAFKFNLKYIDGNPNLEGKD